MIEQKILKKLKNKFLNVNYLQFGTIEGRE